MEGCKDERKDVWAPSGQKDGGEPEGSTMIKGDGMRGVNRHLITDSF